MLTLILEAVLSLGDFNFHTETCGFPISVFSLSFSQQAHKAYERPMDSMGCLLNYSRCSFIIPLCQSMWLPTRGTTYVVAYCVSSADELEGRSRGKAALPHEKFSISAAREHSQDLRSQMQALWSGRSKGCCKGRLLARAEVEISSWDGEFFILLNFEIGSFI